MSDDPKHFRLLAALLVSWGVLLLLLQCVSGVGSGGPAAGDAAASEVVAEEAVEITEGLSIEGRLVTDAGEPIAGAMILSNFIDPRLNNLSLWGGRTRGDCVPSGPTAVTGDDGGFVLRRLNAGSYGLLVLFPHAKSGELGFMGTGPDGETRMIAWRHHMRELPVGTTGYRWVLPRPRYGEIRGQVVTGVPGLHHIDVGLRSSLGSWTLDGKLDRGRFSMKHVLVGSYEMTLWSPTLENRQLKIEVRAGKVTDLGRAVFTSVPAESSPPAGRD